MPESPAAHSGPQWYSTGIHFFSDYLHAIRNSSKSVFLESYHFTDSPLGNSILEACIEARRRGVKVQVLIDSLGSNTLSRQFFAPLQTLGGEVGWFNDSQLRPIRDHRKLLVCDDSFAFLGGFNIAPEYLGDGTNHGWRDAGLRLTGTAVSECAIAFQDMFHRCHRPTRLLSSVARRQPYRQIHVDHQDQLVLGGPGRNRSPLLKQLSEALIPAKNVTLVTPYFLPSIGLRRRLFSIQRRGGQVTVILPGKNDIPISQLAAEALYTPMLRAGIKIFEYQPQMLHAKLYSIDREIFIGSANLDTRSLRINYELLYRTQSSSIVDSANQYIQETIAHSKEIQLSTWRTSQTWLSNIKQRMARLFLSRVDPYVTFWLVRRKSIF